MIKLFLADCDGTLTDGLYHTTENGEISKNFYTRDFHGMLMLHQAGVKIGVITAASDMVVVHQCRRGAKYAIVYKGIKDKLECIKDVYVENGKFTWDEIAFIGDDLFDIGLLKTVGLGACPEDAVELVRELVYKTKGFESNWGGGEGCVRDFAEYVLKINEAVQ